MADKVIIELNRHHPQRVCELSDIVLLPLPPHRDPLPIRHPLDRIGLPYATVDPGKIVAVVETDAPSTRPAPRAPDPASAQVAEHLVRFFRDEIAAGRLPEEFLPAAERRGLRGQRAHRRPRRPPRRPAVHDVHRGVSGLVPGRHARRAAHGRQLLRPDAVRGQAAGALRRPGLLRAAHRAPPAGALQPPHRHPPARRHRHQHRPGGGHLRARQLLARVRDAADERPRRRRRLRAQRPPLGVRVPLDGQGRQDLGRSCRSAATSTTASTPPTSSSPSRVSPTCVASAPPSARGASSTTAPTRPTATTCTRTWSGARQGHIRHDLARCFELHRNFMEHGAMLPDLDFSLIP